MADKPREPTASEQAPAAARYAPMDAHPSHPAPVPAAAPVPQLVQIESEETRRSQALANAQQEAERLQMDETVPGGQYKVGDRFVDANGKELKD